MGSVCMCVIVCCMTSEEVLRCALCVCVLLSVV